MGVLRSGGGLGAGSQGYPIPRSELGRRSEKEEAFTLGFWLPGSILLWGKQIFCWLKAQRNWTSDTAPRPLEQKLRMSLCLGLSMPFCHPEAARGWPEPRAWGSYPLHFAQASTLSYRDTVFCCCCLNIFLTLLGI